MVRTYLWLITGLAVVGLSAPALVADDPNPSGIGPVFGEQPVPPSALQVGGPPPNEMLPLSCPTCVTMYNNTFVCTPEVQALAVGGKSSGLVLRLRDWFIISGGQVIGFDLFVMNGGPGARGTSHLTVQFYEGTDATSLGDLLLGPPVAGFTSSGFPSPLARIPARSDPVTGLPRLMRVTVDYIEKTYTIVDVEDETVLVGPQDIGARPSFFLPGGKVGVDVRLSGELSWCSGGTPVAGPVLASGGPGNENGLHIPGADDSECAMEEYPLICDNPDWEPFDDFGDNAPCLGGDVCSLNRPHFGIALALYVGAGEDAGDPNPEGNNEIATADMIDLDGPNPPTQCQGPFVSLFGFIGDNPVSDPDLEEEVDFFRCDGVGEPLGIDCADLGGPPGDPADIDLLDIGCFMLCFGKLPVRDECKFFDHDPDGPDDPLTPNGVIDLDDLEAFWTCSSTNPCDERCSGVIPGPPELLQDVDFYRISGLTPGHVLSVLVEGDKSPAEGPLWDPYLKIFKNPSLCPEGCRPGCAPCGECPPGCPYLEVSDDYERFSFDAFTTVEVPEGVNTVFIGVSALQNNDYDPQDPRSATELDPAFAGGYKLTVGLTDPNCVIDICDINPDDPNCGSFTQCFETKHEPDDTLADADDRCALCQVRNASGVCVFPDPEPLGCLLPRGMIGDGAFADTGQDVDIYKIVLDGARSMVRSMLVVVAAPVGGGFETVFDLALGLYDSSGELIATGDQSLQGGLGLGVDESRPQLGAKVCGSGITKCDENASPDPGVYYVAVFGTDRGLFRTIDDEDLGLICVLNSPAVPPSLLNFPHGESVAGTNDSDLRPTVGGRVNKPGPPLEGWVTVLDPNPPERFQCYKLFILTDTAPLFSEPPADLCEGLGGDDSIPSACNLSTFDRLSAIEAEKFHLGNGIYGGFQGDVDFYSVAANPGQIIAASTADSQPPDPDVDHPVRTYLTLFDQNAFLIADHDYSHEHLDESEFDGVSDEFAATVVGEMPSGVGNTAFLVVSIDNGNLELSENVPIDASRQGMTLSRRFAGQTTPVTRAYNVGVAVMDKLTSLSGSQRMFAVPARGIDDRHTSCSVNSTLDGLPACFPPILELDPVTGATIRVLDGEPFFSPDRRTSGIGDPNMVESSKPLIAYDGTKLYLSVEFCTEGGGDPQCLSPRRRVYRLDPDLPRTDTDYINLIGELFGFPGGNTFTGMAEISGKLYALDTTDNALRFWNKNSNPAATNGGTMTPTPHDSEDPATEDIPWDDLDGDLGTDGTRIFVGCTLEGDEHGICVFTPNPVVCDGGLNDGGPCTTNAQCPPLDPESPPGTCGTIVLNGKLDDPITNTELVPGPILGGMEVIDGNVIVNSDKRGLIIQHWTGWNINDPKVLGSIQALELPREFQVVRISMRTELP